MSIIVGLVLFLSLAWTLLLPTGRFQTDSNRIFQQVGGKADIVLRWAGAADQVRLSGDGFSASSADGRFVGVPAGWYSARLYRDGFPGAAIKVGVGDVYVVAGQSNSVSQVQPEGWKPEAPVRPGQVILSEYYRSGLRDPGARPLSTYLYDAGVTWQYAGMALKRPYPVMFVLVGLGNTSTERWSHSETYSRITDAVKTFGPKAVLWHQGESDCTIPPVPESTSYANMAAMIDGVGGNTPWVMAINSTSLATPSGLAEWPIRQAQHQIIDTYANVLQGPDTDPIRNGHVEFLGDDLRRHGELWASTLATLGL